MRRLILPMVVLVLCVAAYVFYPYYFHTDAGGGDWLNEGVAMFLAASVGLLAVFASIGIGCTRNVFGILLSARNAYSLSQLQMVLWTWVVLSSLLAVAGFRAWGGAGGSSGTALSIRLSGDLLSVMGIAFFSGAVVPSITTLKAQSAASPEAVRSLSLRLKEAVQVTGQSVVRADRRFARFSDLIRGDDVGSAGTVDLGKVQNLILTIILISFYIVMTIDLFISPEPFVDEKNVISLPSLSEGMATLLLISHAGYLGAKVAPKPDPASPPETITVAGTAAPSEKVKE